MSTIAYKDGVMVGDKRMNMHTAHVTKIHRLQGGTMDGYLMGGSGSMSDLLMIKDWLEDKLDEVPEKNWDDNHVMVIDKEGGVHAYLSQGFAVPIEEPFWSIGSGSQYAMGAMEAGATAEEAVQIASKFDHYTGPEKDLLYL